MDAILFYLLAAAALGGAVVMIGQRNPIYSAFALIVTLCALSGIYGLLGSPLIAALQVVVYAGAIMVLFLFVAGLPVHWLPGQAHALLGACDAAVVASGTATVEAALLGAPLAVVYRLSALTYRLGRPFVKVPHYAMVNLSAGREVVPEIIQRDFTPERVAEEALSLLEDEARRGRMRQDLEEVRWRLGGPGASARAARALLDTLATPS